MNALLFQKKPDALVKQFLKILAAVLSRTQLSLFVIREIADYLKYKLSRMNIGDLLFFKTAVLTAGVLIGMSFSRFFKKIAVLLWIVALISTIIFFYRLIFNKK